MESIHVSLVVSVQCGEGEKSEVGLGGMMRGGGAGGLWGPGLQQ